MKLRNKRTGDIWEFDCGFSMHASQVADSIAELNEEWEDYKPIEPLIDDKEIRKAVRAWAEANDAGKLKYSYDENSLNDIYRNSITFNRGLGLEDGHTYTIPELCGEEEAPEPIEPMFIDLDERVKEKEEE